MTIETPYLDAYHRAEDAIHDLIRLIGASEEYADAVALDWVNDIIEDAVDTARVEADED